jgi:hypothetical protein
LAPNLSRRALTDGLDAATAVLALASMDENEMWRREG